MTNVTKAATGVVYHVFNKSIAGYKIFNTEFEYSRIIKMLRYYQLEKIRPRFSKFMEQKKVQKYGFNHCFPTISADKEKLVQIIAYCPMPTHLHLILKQLKDNGISRFMSNILNSYTRYFNTKHKRKGPLWVSRSKKVLVKTDEQLLHLTRYLHLNPTTAHLVEKPEEWPYSSYAEYLSTTNDNDIDKICKFDDLLDINPISYKKFVDDGINDQRALAKIKRLLKDTS